MSSPPDTIGLHEVLTRMSAEMAGLAARVERIEAALSDDGACPVADASGRPGRGQRRDMRDVQEIDILRQILDDQARLLSHLASMVPDPPLDRATIREALRLRSLADRLLSPADASQAEDLPGGSIVLF